MYNGSIINESATLAFNVKSNLTGGAFTAVKLSDTGIVTATAGDILNTNCRLLSARKSRYKLEE